MGIERAFKKEYFDSIDPNGIENIFKIISKRITKEFDPTAKEMVPFYLISFECKITGRECWLIGTSGDCRNCSISCGYLSSHPEIKFK